jgi:hypothetical protein
MGQKERGGWSVTIHFICDNFTSAISAEWLSHMSGFFTRFIVTLSLLKGLSHEIDFKNLTKMHRTWPN